MKYVYTYWWDLESCVIELPRIKEAGLRVSFRERNKLNKFMLRIPKADLPKAEELLDEDGVRLFDDWGSGVFVLPEVAFKTPWIPLSEFEKIAHTYEVVES